MSRTIKLMLMAPFDKDAGLAGVGVIFRDSNVVMEGCSNYVLFCVYG